MRKPTIWPRYRVSQWIDTGPESMSQPEPTIRYGVQIQRSKGGQWLHCKSGNTPLLYDTEEVAEDACNQFAARDSAQPQ